MPKVFITDTTLRDAHQSLAATRMKTSEMLPVAPLLDSAGILVFGGMGRRYI